MDDFGDFHNTILFNAQSSHGYGSFEGAEQDQGQKSNSVSNHNLGGGKNNGPLDIKDILSSSSFDALLSGSMTGSCGDDVLSSLDEDGYQTLKGGKGIDTLLGNHHDKLYGNAGNDILDVSPGEGRNQLYGGLGDDTLIGAYRDQLHGDNGNDTLMSVAAGKGHNKLWGGSGNDTLYANHHDVLYGGSGHDKIIFREGNNTATGGGGRDEFQLAFTHLPDGPNTILDFRANDTLSIRNVVGINEFSDLTITQKGDNVVISFEDEKIAILKNQDSEHITEESFVIEPALAGLNQADFANSVTNPYFPLQPGTNYVYEGLTEEGLLERITIDVLSETREVFGIKTTVQRDVVYVDGVLHEDTLDFYAQDKQGNVWYFGEEVKNYDENGVFSNTHGSWMAGVDGAVPGIYMTANPGTNLGKNFQQEFLKDEAEDFAALQAINRHVTTPAGSFRNVLQQYEYTPLENDAKELKYYAPGVGIVQTVNLLTNATFKLIEFNRPLTA